MAKRPGGVMVQGTEATRSQLIPVITKWHDLGKTAQLGPVLFCIVIFFGMATFGSTTTIVYAVARRTHRGANGHWQHRRSCYRLPHRSPVPSRRRWRRGRRGCRWSGRRIDLAPGASKGQYRDGASVSLDQGYADGVLTESRANGLRKKSLAKGTAAWSTRNYFVITAPRPLRHG
jgi:hypothetical protein